MLTMFFVIAREYFVTSAKIGLGYYLPTVGKFDEDIRINSSLFLDR